MDAMVNQNSAIFKALNRVMKPLVRLMLARGITYIQFSEWLKHIFVETAISDFALPDKATNDSRISILTGVHRKDVRRLREQIDQSVASLTPMNVNLGSQIVATWLANPLYTQDNTPKVIPRLRKQGGDISFDGLAELVTKDVRARAILDELVRVGAVHVDDNDMVTLLTDAFIPSKGEDEKAYYLGLGLGDHGAAAVHNVLNIQPAYFDRLVHYNNLPVESVQYIEQLAREQSSQLLQSINKEAEKIASSQPMSEQHAKRFSLGVYFYTEDEKPD
jgi:hypothetical protein